MKKSFIGKITSAKLTLSGDSPLTLAFYIEFEKEDKGYIPDINIKGINTDFLAEIIAAVGVKDFSKLKGRHCKLTKSDDSSRISMIEPLYVEEGLPFNVEEWHEEFKRKKSGG